LLNFRGIEPVTDVALLSLPCHLGSEHNGLRLAAGDMSNAGLPPSDVDSDFSSKGRGEGLVVFPSGQTELEERVVGAGVHLGSQHSGRGAPSFASGAAPFANQDPPAGQCEFSGAGGPYRAAPDDDNIIRCGHLGLDETF
jgi:hypothetical protein